MTPADFYRSCRVSALRLETRRDYPITGEEDRRRRGAFFTDGRLLEPGPGKLDDLRLIGQLSMAGIGVGRVHLVDVPLTSYLEYELLAYSENVAAGEDVRIVSLGVHPELGADADGQDFVVFDGWTGHGAVVWFDYDDDGQFTGWRVDLDRAVVEYTQAFYETVCACSVPLDVFTAASVAAAG